MYEIIFTNFYVMIYGTFIEPLNLNTFLKLCKKKLKPYETNNTETYVHIYIYI